MEGQIGYLHSPWTYVSISQFYHAPVGNLSRNILTVAGSVDLAPVRRILGNVLTSANKKKSGENSKTRKSEQSGPSGGRGSGRLSGGSGGGAPHIKVHTDVLLSEQP